MKRLLLFLVLLFGTLSPVSGSGAPLMGFFPTPARPEWRSLLDTIRNIGRHGNAVLLQRNVPWLNFAGGANAYSREFYDLVSLVKLSREQGLETIFVVDALNGLDRRSFYGLPPDWRASFGDPRVRRAFKNFALRIVREFQPRFLGLGSEVNTYMAAHPSDAANLVSLYRETYAAVKAAAPTTLVFTTFQWDELRRLPDKDRWRYIEAFEPGLDLWAISSYPCFTYQDGILPADYFTPLAARTGKPLAVAEGGCSSRSVGVWRGSPENQIRYLRAIADQLGDRLAFWIYLNYNDIDPAAYAKYLQSPADLSTLNLFAYVGLADAAGLPGPALAYWDRLRNEAASGPSVP